MGKGKEKDGVGVLSLLPQQNLTQGF